MKCLKHPDKEAVTVCNRCGRSMCGDCQVKQNNENYCVDCVQGKAVAARKEERSPVLAGILSFSIPGAGQFYNGQPGKGVFIFLTGWLVIPWFIGIFDAYAVAKKINAGSISPKPMSGMLIMIMAAVAMCFLVAIAVIALLAAIAIPNLLRARLQANESSAQAALKTVAVAEVTYRTANPAYGTLAELGAPASGPAYIDKVLASGIKNGYVFAVSDISAEAFYCSAVPLTPNVTGVRSYCVADDGQVRFKENGGVVAGREECLALPKAESH